MKGLDLYLKVRHAVRIEGLSERAAARRFGIDPRTVNKIKRYRQDAHRSRARSRGLPEGAVGWL